MKNVFRFLAIIFVIPIVGISFYFCDNRLFAWEAKILWQQDPFDELRFKNGSREERAKMSASLIESQHLIGMDTNEVTQILGEETGDYYHSDSNLTYRLTKKGNADWILTLTSNEDGKINQIFIRKSCCSISRKAVDFILSAAFR